MKKSNSKNIIKKIAVIFPLCVGILFAIILMYLAIVDNVEVFQKKEVEHSRSIAPVGYQKILDDTAPAGVREVYYIDFSNKLPNDSNLTFYVLHQYVDVYIHDELVYSLKIAENNKFGSTVGSNWAIVPIDKEEADKMIKVVITPVYDSFIGLKPDFMIGMNHEVVISMLINELPRLFLGGTAIVVGFMFIIIGIYISVVKGDYAKLALLGTFAMMMGLWYISDSIFVALIMSEKTSLLFYTSLAMLMIGTVPMLYIGKLDHTEKFKNILNICCIFVTSVCLLQLLLQLFGIVEIREILIMTHLIIATISVLVIIDSFISKIIENKNGKSRPLGSTLIICTIGIIADLLTFYITGSSVKLQYSLLALLICTIVAGVRIIHTYSEQAKQIEEKEAELAEKRIAMMLSQIQPHFLYNSISAIQGLCVQDPEKARTALGDFASYLRGNLNSLVASDSIPFTKELSHVETYLKLEKMRFEDRLQVVYDIEEKNFRIPPLVIQPLVENAVKHGVCKNENGGTVTIKTRKKDDKIIIAIIDDGVGFDYKKLDQTKEDRPHIGLQNVRDRLKQTAGAELIINSSPGKGTSAYIILGEES